MSKLQEGYSLQSIERRNQLRFQSGLPPLNILHEVARLESARKQEELNAAFARAHEGLPKDWANNFDGWFANYGRWLLSRKRFEAQFKPE